MTKRNLLLSCMTIFSIVLLFPLKGEAQSYLVGWSMQGQANYGDSILPAVHSDTLVTVSPLTKNFITSSSGLSDAWGGKNFLLNTDVGGPYYAEFSITPNDSLHLALSELHFNFRRSATGPSSALLQYRFESDTFTTLTTLEFPGTSTDVGTPVDFNLYPPLTTINQTVYFRIIPYGASSATGTWYIPHIDGEPYDFYILGRTYTLVVPDTTSVVDTTACLPVQTLSIADISPNNVFISWDYDTLFPGPFYINYREYGTEEWREEVVPSALAIGNSGAPYYFSHTIDNLEDSTCYETKIVVVCEGEEYDSDIVAFTTLSAPSSAPQYVDKSMFKPYFSADNLYIENPQNLEIENITIYNLQGQEIFQQREPYQAAIALPCAEKGLYILQFYANKQRYIYKLMK